MPPRRTKPRLSEWAIVALTGGLVIVGLLQWLAVRESVTSAERSTTESLHTTERAWVHMRAVQQIDPTASGPLAEVAFLLKNSGRGPALNVVAKAALAVSHDVPERYPASLSLAEIKSGLADPLTRAFSVAIIAGGQEREFFVPNRPPISPEAMQAIRQQKRTLYLFGECLYEDEFHRPFSTSFAAYLEPATGAWRDAAMGNSAK